MPMKASLIVVQYSQMNSQLKERVKWTHLSIGAQPFQQAMLFPPPGHN